MKCKKKISTGTSQVACGKYAEYSGRIKTSGRVVTVCEEHCQDTVLENVKKLRKSFEAKDPVEMERVEMKAPYLAMNLISIDKIVSGYKGKDRNDLLGVFTALNIIAFKGIEVDSLLGFISKMLKKKYKTVSFKVRQLEAMGLIQISRKGKEAGRKWKSFKKVVIL